MNFMSDLAAEPSFFFLSGKSSMKTAFAVRVTEAVIKMHFAGESPGSPARSSSSKTPLGAKLKLESWLHGGMLSQA